MSRLSRDPDLQERLGDQRPFLEDAMYRLALNDASHMKNRVKAFNPTNAFERYSDEEKKDVPNASWSFSTNLTLSI